MNWKDIQLNEFENRFYYRKKPLFKNQHFIAALKFHAPGLAPVQLLDGWTHIDVNGQPIYEQRYERSFGYYNNRAAVESKVGYFHIDEKGHRINNKDYTWCGNFQSNLCAVSAKDGTYHHIDLLGKRVYTQNYHYTGDFYYGFACVTNEDQLCTHIDTQGRYLHSKWFQDIGVYHKGYATAKDKDGWFHINYQGNAIYEHRFAQLEPFYNAWAFVKSLKGTKMLVNEKGILRNLGKSPQVH